MSTETSKLCLEKTTVIIPAISVQRDGFLERETVVFPRSKKKLGIYEKISKGVGFEIIEAELEDTIFCDEHKQDLFALSQNMRGGAIQGKPNCLTVNEAVASFVSRVWMWEDGKRGHGLLMKPNNSTNIMCARCKDGRIITVCCEYRIHAVNEGQHADFFRISSMQESYEKT